MTALSVDGYPCYQVCHRGRASWPRVLWVSTISAQRDCYHENWGVGIQSYHKNSKELQIVLEATTPCVLLHFHYNVV